MFITFEGIEGSGKTTQNHKCAEFLKTLGYDVVQTREPGGTALGAKLRQLILDPEQAFAHPQTEILLFYADRLEHVAQVIKPALAKGQIVLCDRYIDSTRAYQIGGRKMPADFIESLNAQIDLMPDLTVLFDLDPQEGIRRAAKRAALDRFEHEALAFHQAVRDTYLSLAHQEPHRIWKIEVAGLDPEAVFSKVSVEIQSRIQQKQRVGG